jgi:hypothetical protein
LLWAGEGIANDEIGVAAAWTQLNVTTAERGGEQRELGRLRLESMQLVAEVFDDRLHERRVEGM